MDQIAGKNASGFTSVEILSTGKVPVDQLSKGKVPLDQLPKGSQVTLIVFKSNLNPLTLCRLGYYYLSLGGAIATKLVMTVL